MAQVFLIAKIYEQIITKSIKTTAAHFGSFIYRDLAVLLQPVWHCYNYCSPHCRPPAYSSLFRGSAAEPTWTQVSEYSEQVYSTACDVAFSLSLSLSTTDLQLAFIMLILLPFWYIEFWLYFCG